MRSVIPPCPGILCPKSLMLKARLKPEAKNPPNGATRDAKIAITRIWMWYGAYGTVVTVRPSCTQIISTTKKKSSEITYQAAEEDLQGSPHLPLVPNKHRVGGAPGGTPDADTKITDRADHVIPLHEYSSPN